MTTDISETTRAAAEIASSLIPPDHKYFLLVVGGGRFSYSSNLPDVIPHLIEAMHYEIQRRAAEMQRAASVNGRKPGGAH